MDDTTLLSNRPADAIEESQAGLLGSKNGTGSAPKGSDATIAELWRRSQTMTIFSPCRQLRFRCPALVSKYLRRRIAG